MTVQSEASPRWMRVEQAASHLGMSSRRTLDRWRAEGRGPRYTKREGLIFYSAGDLDAWMAEGLTEPADGEGVNLPGAALRAVS